MSGGEEYAQVRLPGSQLPRQFRAVHPMHLDIGYQQVDRAGILLDYGQCISSAGCLQYLIAVEGQDLNDDGTDAGIIVDNQDRFLPSGGAQGDADRLGDHFGVLMFRQPDVKCRTVAWFALGPNPSTALPDD